MLLLFALYGNFFTSSCVSDTALIKELRAACCCFLSFHEESLLFFFC
jgi:hypothetical protein